MKVEKKLEKYEMRKRGDKQRERGSENGERESERKERECYFVTISQIFTPKMINRERQTHRQKKKER